MRRLNIVLELRCEKSFFYYNSIQINVSTWFSLFRGALAFKNGDWDLTIILVGVEESWNVSFNFGARVKMAIREKTE